MRNDNGSDYSDNGKNSEKKSVCEQCSPYEQLENPEL